MNPKARNPIKDIRGKKVKWRAQYSITVDGKTIRKSAGMFDTKAEAKKQTDLKVAELIRITENKLVETEMTVQQFMEDHWLDHRATQLKSMNKSVMFQNMIKLSDFGQMEISKVNAVSLRRFWLEVEDYLIENNFKISSLDGCRSNMNSMLDFAVQKAFIESNENYGLKIRSGRSDKLSRSQSAEQLWEKSKKIWTMEQIAEYLPLFENMKKKSKYVDSIMWWAFFNIGIHTGLRRGEIIALKFSDFDREKRILTIKRSVTLTDNREIIIDKPKANSFGQIQYSEDLDPILDDLEMYHLLNGTLEYEYLIQYKSGGITYPDYWSRMWKRVQIEVGIPKDEILPSSHYLRHTHLSMLAHNGYSMTEIQRRARHTDPRTTAKYYVHILDEKDKEMAESFSNLLKVHKLKRQSNDSDN